MKASKPNSVKINADENLNPPHEIKWVDGRGLCCDCYYCKKIVEESNSKLNLLTSIVKGGENDKTK
jgi:hypothetical protein